MKKVLLLVVCIALTGPFGCIVGRSNGDTTVNPEKCVIVLPSDAKLKTHIKNINLSSAKELQKHLKLVTGTDIPIVDKNESAKGKYVFYIDITPASDKKALAPQESRWMVTPAATYFYGSPQGYGAQFAVYSFLNEQLGVDWTEPGDEGIVYKKMSPLALQSGSYNWTPELMFRKIRLGGARVIKKMPSLGKRYKDYAEFQPKLEYHNKFAEEVILWQKRLRMGGSRPGGGHAFSRWWKKYGKTHPEYFALNQYGRREPVKLAKANQTDEFVKICPSNPKVAEQLIQDWLPRSGSVKYVNTGINDGIENFCECENCKKLDVQKEGEKPLTHLTDRYVYLTNEVARQVKKYRPDAYVAMYAYLTTLYPPRKLKLEPNVVVQAVPYVIPLDLNVTEKLLNGWYNAGAKKLAFRPNYHCKYLTTTIPLGIEKQMFDVFQIAVKNGCISADYDSLTNNWPVTGITDYILAKSMADPEKPFSYWENKYYSAFGSASGDVKKYFRYWRNNIWNKRLAPAIKKICNKGGAGDFSRGLFWSLGDYYKLSDFDETDAILKAASARKLTSVERSRLNELILANKHARLMFEAVAASPMDKSEYAAKLLAFRKKYRKELKLQWIGVFAFELGNGDLAGFEIAKQMKGYLRPWLPTELFWRFKMDPEDRGLKEKWQDKSWRETADWEMFRTDRFWEKQYNFDETNNLSDATNKVIGTYDGIGWYATQLTVPAQWKNRKIFLRFGAVDESCRVYVNGKFAGEHLYKHKNDWKTPFEIRINELIDWNKERQLITVRVEDKGGAGGIWRKVWLVSKK